MSKVYTAMLEKMAIRNKKIYLMRKAGELSDIKIGKMFGITRQRVKAIFVAQLLKQKEANEVSQV
jgi:DNA-directed RNA polymerase specialized sigma subunit